MPQSPSHSHTPPALSKRTKAASPGTSVLGWSAWLRVLAVLPVLVVLWLAVGWACAGASPW